MPLDSWGSFFALDANTGSHLWNNSLGGYSSSPAIADGKIFVTKKLEMMVFEESTGEVLWSYDFEGGHTATSSPAVANGRVYVGMGSDVYCFGSMLFFNLKIDPMFFDNTDDQIFPYSWKVRFPNGTLKTEYGPQTYYGPLGLYSIRDVNWSGIIVSLQEPVSFLARALLNVAKSWYFRHSQPLYI